MLVRSEPRCPADRQRLGDHAVERNHADRSQPMLNAVMDSRFEPVHRTWKTLWASEQRAEKALETAFRALVDVETLLGRAFDELLEHRLSRREEANRWLAPFLPPELLAGRRKPGPIRATVLTPFLHALEDLRDEVTEDDLETHFRQQYQRAVEHHGGLEAARRSLTEARAERSAADETWDESYRMYHLTVEFVARSDPDRIRRWILPWPPDQANGGEGGAAGA